MKLNREEYVLERTTDGGYFAWLSNNLGCNAYGDSPEEAVDNLKELMRDLLDEMYLVEDYI